jgi:hypothetical protein
MLTGVFPPGSPTPRRLRLRTNMEIYWDSLAVATALPRTPLRTREILPQAADLRYRGFSAVHQAARSSPELPEYQEVAGTAQQWLDLTGFYTRFGDVRELLRQVDDRYVIMNAGDEIRLRFPAPPPPPPGWTRDFVFISDGWDKDGNFNTGFSKTVLPLPSHDQPDYRRPPGRLEDDPVRHAEPLASNNTYRILRRAAGGRGGDVADDRAAGHDERGGRVPGSSRKGQIAVAFCIALVEAIFRLFQNVDAPFYALFIVGPIAFLIEIWWKSRPAGAKPTPAAA